MLPASITRQPLFPVTIILMGGFSKRRTRKRKRSRGATGVNKRRRGARKPSRVRTRQIARHSAYTTSLLQSKKVFVMQYADHYNVSIGPASNMETHVFRANSVFDPDFTGVGHQPRGYDQVKDMYEEWHVVASKIKIRVFDRDEDGEPLGIAILPSATNALPTTIVSVKEILEDGAAKWKIVNGKKSSSTMNTPVMLSHKMSVPKFLGQRNGYLNDDNAGHTAGTNPNEQVGWCVVLFSLKDLATVHDVSFTADISYVVVATQPKVLISS